MNIVKIVLTLINDGFQPCSGEVDGIVYERLQCNRRKHAQWFGRAGLFVCVGCSRQCTCADGAGFQQLLPMEAQPAEASTGVMSIADSRVLLAKRQLLRVDEAADVLRVSRSQIYNLVRLGRLDAHVDKPLRVTSESVATELQRLDV